ncbi:ATP synthase subunit I [Thiobacillus sp.]|uniref:ATP synthase subunit I n=1 Tax=Thiobacillus sp. TaxID=924 RepID=UPI0025D18F82|nr:ATP synthase subunit I [Thiobacillus sp.]MBT9540539.1 ATP synthase subunit I [Thiobacillus sp.]
MFFGTQSAIQRVARAQAVLAPVAAVLGGVFVGLDAALAALFGGLVALAVSGVLVWREQQSMRHPEWDQHRLFRLFIRAGVERMLVLVGLLGLGLAVLKLSPLPMLLGLLLAQFGWLAAAQGRKN